MNKKNKRKLISSLKIKQVVSVLAVLAVAGVGTYLLNASKAATGNATFSATSASANITKDATFSVGVYENSGGTAVNAVNVNMAYDASKLQFVSASNAGSQFATCPFQTGSNGLVNLVCFLTPPNSVTQNQLIATVTFKATATGSANVSFTSGSEISEDGSGVNVWDTQPATKTFTISNPSTPTTPTTPSNPSTPSTPTNSGGSGGSNSGGTSNGGTTNKSTGSSSGTGSRAPVATNTGDPVVSTPDQSSNEPVYDGVVSVTILGEDGKPAANVKVTLNKQTATTDESGVASFFGVRPGKYKLEAKGVLGAATKDITVVSSATATDAQKFDLKLEKNFDIMKFVIPGAAVILAIVFILLIVRWFKNRPLRPSGPSGNTVFVNGMNKTGADEDPMTSPLQMPSVVKSSDTTPVETPKTGKESVEPTDTLDQIEKKVGASKTASATGASPVKPGTGSEDPISNEPLGGSVITPTQDPTDPVS